MCSLYQELKIARKCFEYSASNAKFIPTTILLTKILFDDSSFVKVCLDCRYQNETLLMETFLKAIIKSA